MKIVLGLLIGAALVAAQDAPGTPDAHVARARTAAGDAYRNLFEFLCAVPAPQGGGRQGGGARGTGRARCAPLRGTAAGGRTQPGLGLFVRLTRIDEAQLLLRSSFMSS